MPAEKKLCWLPNGFANKSRQPKLAGDAAGAEAILKLRSMRSSGDLDEYWLFHRSRSRERNHCEKYADHQLPRAA